MDCNEVKGRLTLFLDDMLSENEHQDFLRHLADCVHCNDYVNAVDSLSNQLRRLGDVKVPSDLTPAVFFKLKQPLTQVKPFRFAVPEKWILRVLVLFLTAVLLFLGIYAINSRKSGQENAAARRSEPLIPEKNDNVDKGVRPPPKEFPPIVVEVTPPSGGAGE